MKIKPGDWIKGRYEILSLLGEGSFGVTYRAVDHLINRFVAIKCSGQNLAHEARMLRALENVPHISHIYDYFAVDGKYFIVMRLIKGRSVSDFCKDNGGKISTNDIKRMLPSLVITIGQMHERGIIHRDLSPKNFIIAEEGTLYLIDFGAATSIRDKSLRNRFTYTHKGLDSPEVNEPNLQGPWTDVYTLCSMIVYMLSGEGIPKAGDRRIVDPVPQMLMGLSLNGRMQNALLKGLSLDLSRRYSTIENFADDFLGIREGGRSDPPEIAVSYHARTTIGKRDVNQDNFVIDTLFAYADEDCEIKGYIDCGMSEYHAVAVADGVAGVNHAELASKAAIQAVSHFIDYSRNDERLAQKLVEELLTQINEKILTLGSKIGTTATTLTVMLWKGDEYCITNVGDSPIYLLRDRKLKTLTRRHTLANEKLENNQPVSAADLHKITAYMGKPMTAGSDMAYICTGRIKKGDIFLIATDGVSNSLSENQIIRYMKKDGDVAMKKIFAACNKNPNMDNCTAIILKICMLYDRRNS